MMHILESGSEEHAAATGDLYVGGDITFALLSGTHAGHQTEVYRVDFAPGARNRVHIHKHDQILIGHTGRGIIADASGETIMEPCDVVTIPAGHPHWHGATETDAFSHLTVAVVGDEIEIVDTDARGYWGAL